MEEPKESSDVGKQRKYNEGGITGKGFKPGQSGNPSGRPKGSVSIAATLRHIITQEQANQIAQDLIAQATSVPLPKTRYTQDGDSYEAYDPVEVKLYESARNIVLERLDGKVPQKLSGDPDGNPIDVLVRYDREAKHASD